MTVSDSFMCGFFLPGVLLAGSLSFMPLHTLTAAEQASYSADAKLRAQEEAKEASVEMLRERGLILSRMAHAVDHRIEDAEKPETPKKKLVRTSDYIELKATVSEKGGMPSYLKDGAQGKTLTKRQLRLIEEEKLKLTPAQFVAAVHDKTKALVTEAQKATVAKAEALAQRHDSLGVFRRDVNEVRALSVCRRELRRTVSLPQLKREAAQMVSSGVKPRSEAAAAAAEAMASGSTASIRTPDMLMGRLELLDEQFAAAQAAAEQRSQAKITGGRRGGGKAGGSSRARGMMALAPAGTPSSAAMLLVRSSTVPGAPASSGAPAAAPAGPALGSDAQMGASVSMPNLGASKLVRKG